MAEFANKYEEEARQIVEDLQGTRWAEDTRSGDQTQAPLQALKDYAISNPLRAVLIAGSIFFIFGALYSVLRR